MKQYINFLIITLSITFNLQASLPVKYWNDNVDKPKSTIQKNIPLKEKCNRTLAMIKERKTVNLEKSIPLLMEAYTKEIHSQPETELKYDYKIALFIMNGYIKLFTKDVTDKASNKTFKTIIDKEFLVKKGNISLLEYGYIPYILSYLISLPDAVSIFNKVIILPSYHTSGDAYKLFVLNHELQHQLNGDNHNRTSVAILSNKCQLADLEQTPYVQSILKPNVRNNKGQNLQDLLHKNSAAVTHNVCRYEEFRADTKAIENMHCPHCVQETFMHKKNGIGYRPTGYLYQWQFQPRIEKLKRQGTMCQHHHENGEKIDTSICDGSTLEKRMVILDKKNI